MVRAQGRLGGAHGRPELKSGVYSGARFGRCQLEDSYFSIGLSKHEIDERGVSLRFPRFLRVRDDKSADDATGPEQVSDGGVF